MIENLCERLKQIPEPNLKFWRDSLRVDVQMVQDSISSNETELFIELITKLFKNIHMFKVIKLYLNLEPDNKHDILDLVVEHHRTDPIILILLLVQELLNKKSKDAIIEIGILFLNDEEKLISNFFDEKPLYQCILLFSRSVELLEYYYLFDKAERSAYKQHSIHPDDENEHNIIETLKDIQQGINFTNWATVSVIETLLDRFEDKFKPKKRSKLLKLLNNDDYLTAYIQRTSKRENINEHDTTIWGNQTDIIILEFLDSGRLLRERSTEQKGVEIAGFLSSKAYQRNLKYIPYAPFNTLENFRNYLNNLLTLKDSQIELREIEYENFPVVGRPTIVISRNEKTGGSISLSITDLKEKGFDLFANLENIKKIKIGFKVNSKDKFNNIILYPVISDTDVSLQYSNNNLSRYKTNYFSLYMNKEHKINASPTSQEW